MLTRLINCATIVAALYLPACGGEQTDPTPVVTPPDPVVQMGTLEVSSSGQMMARITIGTTAVANGEPVALPFTTTLVVGSYHVTVVEMDGRKSEFDVMVKAGKTTPVIIPDPPPDIEWINHTLWNVWNATRTELLEVSNLTTRYRPPNEPVRADIPPCPTGAWVDGFPLGGHCAYSNKVFAQYRNCSDVTNIDTCGVSEVCTLEDAGEMPCVSSSFGATQGVTSIMTKRE